MTRDDLAPLGDAEPFPCLRCSGSGISRDLERCPTCGGSGYGPPPPSLDREKAHCLCRLSKWAHRECAEEK